MTCSVPVRAERFKRLHPEVAVHLQVENTRRCCGAVARGEADLALVGGVMPPDLEHLLQARCHLDLYLTKTFAEVMGGFVRYGSQEPDKRIAGVCRRA